MISQNVAQKLRFLRCAHVVNDMLTVIFSAPKIHRVAKRIEVFENVLLCIVVGILFIADILYHKGVKLLNSFLNSSCRSCTMRYCPATFHASHWQWKHDIHLISININLTIINTIRSVFVTKNIPSIHLFPF